MIIYKVHIQSTQSYITDIMENNSEIENLDIILLEFDKKASLNLTKKILILGNERETLVKDIMNELHDQFLDRHTILSKNIKLFGYELQFGNIYEKFSAMLIERSFRDNWLLYIDSYPYFPFQIDSIEKEIKKRNNNIVIISESVDSLSTDPEKSFLASNIDFDYIMFTDVSVFKNSAYINKLKFNIQNGLGEIKELPINTNQVSTKEKLVVGFDDLEELVNQISLSNLMNEKMYLVLDKQGQFMYYQI